MGLCFGLAFSFANFCPEARSLLLHLLLLGNFLAWSTEATPELTQGLPHASSTPQARRRALVRRPCFRRVWVRLERQLFSWVFPFASPRTASVLGGVEAAPGRRVHDSGRSRASTMLAVSAFGSNMIRASPERSCAVTRATFSSMPRSTTP